MVHVTAQHRHDLSVIVMTYMFTYICTHCHTMHCFSPKFFVSLPRLQTTCCVVWAQVFLSFCLIFLLTNICVHIGLSTTSSERCHHYHNATAQWKGRMMMMQWAQRVRCSLFFFSLFLLLNIGLSIAANDKCRHLFAWRWQEAWDTSGYWASSKFFFVSFNFLLY